MVKSPICQRAFCFQNMMMVRSLWSVQDFIALSRSGVYQYWKDSHSGKACAFCKHKSNSLYNQAVEIIYSLPRGCCDAWCRCLPSELYRPVRRHLIDSIYQRLPRLYDIWLYHDDPYEKMVWDWQQFCLAFTSSWKSWSKDRVDTAA